MTGKLRRQWMIWHVTLAMFLLFLGAAHVASMSRIAALLLQPHIETHLNVVSLLGHDIYLDLEFRRSLARGGDDGLRTNDLGGTRRRPGSGGGNATVTFVGQPVLVEVAINDGPPLRLSATPANRSNRIIVARSLRVEGLAAASLSTDDRDLASRLVARPGLNHLTIRVIDVGNALLGEEVDLVALPPLQASGPQPGYGIFVFAFLLLPVAVVGFILWGMILFIMPTRGRGA